MEEWNLESKANDLMSEAINGGRMGRWKSKEVEESKSLKVEEFNDIWC